MAKKKTKTKKPLTFAERQPSGGIRIVTYDVPESITISRDDALKIVGCIEGALDRLRDSDRALLAQDMRQLERATYILIGMRVPEWLEERYDDTESSELEE